MLDLQELEGLVQRASRGDDRAFAALVRETEGLVARVVHRMLLDPHDAEEVVQEVFMDAHRALRGWEPRARFTTWLYRAATRAALARRRARGRYQRRLQELERRAVAEPAPTPAATAELQETTELIRRAVAGLPEGQQETFVLRHFEQLSLAEVARIRGVAIGTVKAQLSQAVRSLRRSLCGVLTQEDRP
jgi:RNA polymerase sigma-70 factor (ECF subfamily)